MPRAVILGCSAGGALLALRDVLLIATAVEPDWVSLECARANHCSSGVHLLRAPLDSAECRTAVAAARPEILLGSACRKYDSGYMGDTAVYQATDIVATFIASRAHLLLMECPVRCAAATDWTNILKPSLERAGCVVDDATPSALDVGVPSNKQRVFILAVKHKPRERASALSAKLTRWKQRLQQRLAPTPMVGEFLGHGRSLLLEMASRREEHIFLRRALGDPHLHAHHGPQTLGG